MNNESISEKMPSSPKKQKCMWCNNEKATAKHIKEQSCRPLNQRTYCRICDMTLTTRSALIEHMTSAEHMSRIVYSQESDIVLNVLKHGPTPGNEVQAAKTTQVFQLDPYLSTEEEVRKASEAPQATLGRKLTIKYGDGKVYKSATGLDSSVVIEPAKPGMTVKETRVIGAVEEANQVIVKTGFSYADLVRHDEAYPEPTERQQKIIIWLGQWQSSGPEIMREKLKLILDKISCQDADFLMSHIRNSRLLSMPSKQVYCAYIDSVVRVLTTEHNRGVETFAGKDILDFVVKLTK